MEPPSRVPRGDGWAALPEAAPPGSPLDASPLPAAPSDAPPLDLVIVGAGPCGLAAAVAAKEHGLRHAVLDRGCITHSLTRYPYYMTFFSTAERLEIGGVPFAIPEPKPTRREALAYYRHVARRHGLAVRQYEEATTVEREEAPARAGAPRTFTTHTRRTGPWAGRPVPTAPLRSRGVVVATGGFGDPNRLELPGCSDPDGYPANVVHYYKEPYPYFGHDVVVVGGGNSAVETALDLHRNGVGVRMVHFASEFDRGVKPWVRPDIDNRLAGGEIPMHWRSRVARVATERRSVEIVDEATGVSSEHPADWVLAMTGWLPDSALLDGLGVATDPETGIPVHDPATMETNVGGVYLAGVVAAGFDANKIFIENGREHGARVAAHMAAGLAAPARASRPGRAGLRRSPS